MFFASRKSHSDVAIHGRSDTDENGTFFHDFAFLDFSLDVSIPAGGGDDDDDDDDWDTNIHDTHKYPPMHLVL